MQYRNILYLGQFTDMIEITNKSIICRNGKWGIKKKLFLKIIYLKEGDTSKASSKLEILKNI